MDSTSGMRNLPFQEFHSTMEENMDIDLTTEVDSTGTRYSLETSSGTETVGFKTDFFAKYFELKSSFSKIYHYDVKVHGSFRQGGCKMSQTEKQFVRSPELFSVPEEKCKEVVAELLKLNKCEKLKYIYDGKKNLLTSTELPILRKSTIAILLAAGDKYGITIKPIKKYNGTNAITMTVLQNMTLHSEDEVRNNLLELNKILEHRVNSKIRFDSYASISHIEKYDIGKGLEIWRGYEQSINLTKSGPAYVLNVSELIFHKAGPVTDYINELLGYNITEKNRPFTPDEVKEIRNALRGLVVYVTHMPYRRKYSIEDISDIPATDIILHGTEKVMSVAEYYEEKYCRLLFPHFPCLKMRSNVEHPVHIPLENCVIFEGQQKLDYQRTDTGDKLNALRNFASNEPNKRNDSLKKLGLFMDLNQKILHSRGICPPASKCVEGNPQFHHDTSRWGLQGKFSKLKNDSWIVLSFVDETQLPIEKITEFLERLKAVGSTVGLWFGKFLGIQIFGRDEPLDKALKRGEIKNATLAIILLSKTYSHNYDEIKFIADYRLGLITKCVRDDTIYALNERIARNICLSIDTKLGGLTYELAQAPKIFSQPVITFGAVIVRLKKDSIASVVGSLDAYPSRYQVSCRVQEEKKSGKISKDYITDLENMAKAILKSFYHHTKGKYPEKIIFFRNNAVLSNFKLLMYYEVKALQKSCKDIVGHILPITFIVVSKHHHKSTKSVFQKRSGGSQTDKNLGTSVNTDTSSNVFVYTIGNDITDKPTYYYVIHDDNKFTAGELQELTHHMCYIYAGNRYISIPTPIRYAHRAALHAKKYAHCQCSKYETESDDLSDSTRDAINKMECSETRMFLE